MKPQDKTMTAAEIMDLEESQFPPLAKYAFAEAFRKTLAVGESVLVTDGGKMYLVSPDGERTYVKDLKPPIFVGRGRRFYVRK